MKAPSLWCEARCHYLYDEDTVGCRETANGSFGVKEAIKLAKAEGWRILKNEWCCPVCYARKQSQDAP
jgi:rubredoxin